ncbi:hypothetical protein F5Y01DRAFT_255342 [Xylaria sp. FL0043]|nr:hypothetical protein F5Y01DRAFT_255342 [Xylaria sp. FL0043]
MSRNARPTPSAFGQVNSSNNSSCFGSVSSSDNFGSTSAATLFGSPDSSHNTASPPSASLFGASSYAESAPGVSLFGSASSSMVSFGSASSNGASGSTLSPGVRSHGDKMHEILRLQKSDGSWEWNRCLLKILGIRQNPEIQNAVVATALAIAFLEKRMAHEVDSWELIVEKARDWLGQQDQINVEQEISDAEMLLEPRNP